MKLSARSLERLTEIITDNSQVSPYRSGPQLIEFFYDFGERDLYGQGFPARAGYTLEKLRKFNGTETMKAVVCTAFDFWGESELNPENEARQFNRLLARDGYRLVIEHGPGFMQGSEYIKGEPYFEVRPLGQNVITPQTLSSINHEAISEQIGKANRKIDGGDFAGAIATSYTLVEHLLKLLLMETQTQHKQDEGDIRALFKTLREPLGLDPASEAIAAPLKPILDGFQKLIGGLYEIANKASDRHARRYNPAAHHAKLAVNAAFALSEFLVESYEYQNARLANAPRKEASG